MCRASINKTIIKTQWLYFLLIFPFVQVARCFWHADVGLSLQDRCRRTDLIFRLDWLIDLIFYILMCDTTDGLMNIIKCDIQKANTDLWIEIQNTDAHIAWNIFVDILTQIHTCCDLCMFWRLQARILPRLNTLYRWGRRKHTIPNLTKNCPKCHIPPRPRCYNHTLHMSHFLSGSNKRYHDRV